MIDNSVIDKRFFTPRAQVSSARGSIQNDDNSKSFLDRNDSNIPLWDPRSSSHGNPLTIPPFPTKYDHSDTKPIYDGHDHQQDVSTDQNRTFEAYTTHSSKLPLDQGVHGTLMNANQITNPGSGGHTSEIVPGETYESRIFSLARHGRVDEVDILLQQGVPIDARDEFGNTVLCIACQNGNKSMVKVALRHGANINIRNFKGNTPLHFCYRYGYAKTLGKYLMQKGADASLRNLNGELCTDMGGGR